MDFLPLESGNKIRDNENTDTVELYTMVDFFNGREEFDNNSFIKIKNLKSTIFRQHAVSVFDDIFFESDKYRIRTNPNNKSDDETSRLVYSNAPF